MHIPLADLASPQPNNFMHLWKAWCDICLLLYVNTPMPPTNFLGLDTLSLTCPQVLSPGDEAM